MASGTVDLDGLLDTLDVDGLLSELRACQLPPPGTRKQIRERAGLSVRRLAKTLQVHPSTVLGWEAGATPHPRHAIRYRYVLDALESLQ